MNRDIGVDLVKFFAALLITNSHMQLLYGEYDYMATGGSIGDAMFFFCSGYTLFLRPIKGKNFFNWYKRRINRIYPSVFAVAIIGSLIWGVHNDIMDIITHGGNNLPGEGWFIPCIMIYYIALFVVGSLFLTKIWMLFVAVVVGTAVWYYSGITHYEIYCDYIRWLLFFDFMLLGSKIGMMKDQLRIRPFSDAILLILNIVVFYVIFFLSLKDDRMSNFQFFTIFPLFGTIFYIYKVCSSNWIKKIYNSRIGYFVIRFVGGLTLEIYLVQNYLFTDMMNNVFPLNLVIMLVIIVIGAYIARCFARIIAQTFESEPYSWNKIISLY